jgi:hypothetical protein
VSATDVEGNKRSIELRVKKPMTPNGDDQSALRAEPVGDGTRRLSYLDRSLGQMDSRPLVVGRI